MPTKQKPYMYTTTKIKEKKYDIICNLVDKVIKKYNPCNIRLKKIGAVCKVKEICCSGCFYLSNNGCTTSCLGCKLTFCEDLKDDETTHKVMKLLKPLYVLAFLNDYIYIRSNKKEILTKINLTGDRCVEWRNIFNVAAIRYFSYIRHRVLIKLRKEIQ